MFYTHDHIGGTEATCTTPQTCTLCGAVLAEKLPHPYAPNVVAPTCEEQGYTVNTCTVCGDSYTDNYTSPTGHSFVNDNNVSDGYTCDICGKNFPSLLFTYTISFYDYESGKPVPEVNATLGGTSFKSGADGSVSFQVPEGTEKTSLVIEAKDYPTISENEYVLNTAFTDTIILESNETNIHSAYCNGDNVLTGSTQINAHAGLYKAKIAVGGTAKGEILKYEIIQGDNVIAVSTDGKFEIYNPAFTPKEAVTAKMYVQTVNGIITRERELNIKVIGVTFDIKTGLEDLLGMDFGVKLSFPNGTPLLEGINLQVPFDKDYTYSVHIGNNKIIATVGYGKNLLKKPSDDDDKSAKEILKELTDKWVSEQKKSKKIEPGVNASFVFEIGEDGISKVYGELQVSIGMQYNVGKTFMLWIIPVYGEIDMKFDGSVNVNNLGFDIENSKIIVPSLEIELDGSIALYAGVGIPAASVGVYGELGIDLILSTENETFLKRFTIYGEMGVYAKLRLLFFKEWCYHYCFLRGEYTWPQNPTSFSLPKELLSPDAYSDSQRTYLENRSEWLGEKIPLGEALSSFKSLQTSVSDAVEPKLVTCGDDIMMLFLDDDGSEGYNYQHLFFSLYNSETNTWSEPRRVDSNAYPDIEFDAYSDGNDIYIVYTESDEITEDNKENEISVISSIEVSAARFDFDNVGFVGYQRLTDNEIIDTLPQIVCDSEIVYASWVSNPTDDVFAQNANNIVNVSACISGEWGEPYVLSDRGATVTSCDLGVLNGKTLLALVRDIDCNFETFDDRALSFIDMNGNVYNVETSVFQNDGVRFVKRGGKTELMWYNGGFVYTVDSSDAVPENPFGNSLSGIEPDFVYTELENGTSVLVYSKGTIHNLPDGSQVNGSDLFALFIEENGEANDPINLSNLSDGRYISAFDVAPLGSKLVAPYISTLAVFGDEEEFKTENDFMFALFEQTTDISLEDVFVSPESIFDGDSFEIEFNVRNGSWYSASFDYSVVDSENNALLSGSYNGDLVSGETASVAVSLEKALLSADKAYYIVVTPKDIYDSNETNNRAPIALWYSDLSVEAKQILLPSGLEIQYLVSNDGNSSANGVLKIYKEDENGNLTELYSESLKKLSAGESVNGAVAVTDSFFRNGEEKGIVLVRIEYENEEIYSFNDSVYLSVGGIKKTETKDPDANQTTVNNPTLEPPYVQYDKKNGGDVNISVIENGCSFVELIDVDSSNYSYSNGVLSVKESYLRSLESGNYHFHLKYNAGDRFINILLIIDVSTSAYSDVSLTADDQTVKYDGFAVDIADDLEYSTVSKGEASASYSLNGTDWISGLPTDIGVYKIRLFVGEDHENGYLSAECEFVLTIVKGTRAISIPTVISEESVNVLFGNSLVTAGDTDGTILYGYSLINDIETVETWSESGVLPESENDAVYYIFAKIVGGALYEDAFSLGGIAEAHVHSYIQTVTEPDCETEGYTTYTCRCGDSFVDDYVAAKGHAWIEDPEAPPACYTGGTKLQVCLVCGEKTSSSTAVEHIDVRLIVESEATCIEDGISYYYCFECDSQVGDIIIDPAFGHSMYPIGIVNDNVCHDGEYTLYGCYDCEQTYKEYITPPGHDYQNTVTDPICELGGYTTHTCSRCGDSYVDDFTDPLGHVSKGNATCTENCVCAICGEILEGKLGHNYGSVITEPDCELGGYTTHTCSRCGDSYNDSYTQPLGHKAGVEATCTADQVCTVCRKTLVSALGHKYETEITEPSCESSGFTTHTCMRCGNVSKDSFTKPLGHKMGAEATCIADQICTVCKKVLVYALGHSYETVVTKPTGDDAGYTTYTCTRCKHSYKGDFVAPLGHNAGAEATCTTAQTCVDCGKVLVDALGHEYDAVVTEPTCETGGYTTHTCSRCGDSYTDSLTEALGHREGSEATCTTAQTCVDCGKVLVDALGHEYDAVVTSPTCETGGYTTHTCSRCGDSYTDSITEALGHEESEWVIVTEAGLETEGLKEKRCKTCSELLESEIIEPIGYRVGDVNMNGRIDATDYALVKRHCLKTFTLNEKQQLLADVNGNGRVDATDYALIKRHCLKTFDIYA
ncbi:MAG: hypothetical protein IJO64_00920 [Clostridia bacterium]|nr:hypothetical protein [Clostridia bacterium]